LCFHVHSNFLLEYNKAKLFILKHLYYKNHF
jgi:hypothetical protein